MMNTHYPNEPLPLAPTKLVALPLGSIKPTGWLCRQLQTQANGLSGQIEERWQDLGSNSGWLGGDGEAWERGPYYLDGLIPLAYGLNDPRLIQKSQKWVEWILQSQTDDGAFGPIATEEKLDPLSPKNWWFMVPALKALAQYHEATSDDRVIEFLLRFFRYQLQNLQNKPLRSWAQYRSADTTLVIYWLYARKHEPFLLDLAALLRSQAFDWSRFFLNFPWRQKPEDNFENLEHHIVNLAMALKAPTVWAQLSQLHEDWHATEVGLQELDQWHGQATGIWSGDEHLSGLAPTQGTELCAVVEAMFSFAELVRITGKACYGDRLEQLAFNALPATFDKHMRIHQYDQQVNQVLCSEARRNWSNNSDSANIFGIEPHFGCCTANFHQGFPKFVKSLWMATPDNGLAAVAYAPCEVSATVGSGTPVKLVVETDYPFGDVINITIQTAEPTSFPLHLRIPSYCRTPKISYQGNQVSPDAGAFHQISATWNNDDHIQIHLPMHLRCQRRYNNSVSLYYGPLLMALPVEHVWQLVSGPKDWGDHHVIPTAPWNWALDIDPTTVDTQWQVTSHPMAEIPFDDSQPPLTLSMPGRKVPGWELVDNSAGATPVSPVSSAAGESAMLTLVPYGATILRLGELPVCAQPTTSDDTSSTQG